MPAIRRDQILDQLGATLPPAEAEHALRQGLAAAKLEDKALFRAEEVGRLGRALMERAQHELEAEGSL